MATNVSRIHEAILKTLWDTDLQAVGRLKALGIKLARLIYLFASEISEEQLAMRAMSLVYTTLLSIVPLLAVSFSVLKAFGVDTKLLILLYYFMEPLGPQGVDMTMKVIEFVENVKVSVIGSIGLATLIYTVMSQIQKFESALNYIWDVKTTRGFTKRFNNYMSMLLIGPVLVFSAIGAVTSASGLGFMQRLAKIAPFGAAIYFISSLMPYVFVCAAFTFIYYALPNTKVRFKPALTGGVFAGILWVALGQSFTFLIASPAKYSAIYSGFATVLLFLIWLYWNFFILLIGARISYYNQHPHLIALRNKTLFLNIRSKEKLGVLIMFLIGSHFFYNRPAWTAASLSAHIGIPSEVLTDMLEILEQRGLIVSSGDDPPSYFPARDIENISVKEVVDSVRLYGDDPFSGGKSVAVSEVSAIMKLIEDASARAIKKTSLKDLVLSAGDKT